MEARGAGTLVARRQSSESGSMSTATVPSAHRWARCEREPRQPVAEQQGALLRERRPQDVAQEGLSALALIHREPLTLVRGDGGRKSQAAGDGERV